MNPGCTGSRGLSPAAGGSSGFTLVELLVVMLLIGVLIGIAVPSYRSHVLRANRSEGRAALLALATAQEKFHLECHRYAAGIDPGLDADCEAERLRFPTHSERGYYRVAVTSADEVGWSAAATAAGPPQDADARCQRLQLDGTGQRSAVDGGGNDSSLECWSR
jgi:type IV pilus assembly protein PilE